jgi:predicted membrane-bound spermidine synthase
MMALELLGARLLQPTFGSDIDVWASVISVFILSLSLGYAGGGWLADRIEPRRALGWAILTAGICYLLLPVYARAFLERLSPEIQAARWGSLPAATLLFLPPSLLLGGVTPLLVRLGFTDAAHVGRVTGLLFAVGCLGNVLGILVTDYLLLVRYPLTTNLLGIGVVLGVTGVMHLRTEALDSRPPRRRSRQTASASLGAIALISAAWIGARFQDNPYRVHRVGLPADEVAVEHRESPYGHLTWVVSEGENYAQLRFVAQNQGGVCLRPRWDEYARLHPGLRHVAMPDGLPVASRNPGTLVNATYACLFPLAVLLNDRLMAQANGEARAARPNLLMVGLGSGAGVALLAHHFPEASLTVVDIDREVVAMALRHYPFLRWLQEQRTSDGRPRLRLVVGDGRRFVAHPPSGGTPRPYDAAILDVYTLGSTIPPHLMTREFYEALARILSDDGLILSNILGSYAGAKRRVLGGAVRTQRAAGFPWVTNIPILLPWEEPESFDVSLVHPNIVIAGRRSPAPWDRPDVASQLEQVRLYPELPEGVFVSESISLGDGQRYISTQVSLVHDGVPVDAALVQRLRAALSAEPDVESGWAVRINVLADPELIEQARQVVRTHRGDIAASGWERSDAPELIYRRTDWVLAVRETFRKGVAAARAPIEPAEGPLFTDEWSNADIVNR